MPVLGFSSRISRLNTVRYDKNADYKITFNLKLTSKEFEDIMEEAESSYKARSAVKDKMQTQFKDPKMNGMKSPFIFYQSNIFIYFFNSR